ncbi:ArsR/SmtB family transcription factor [Nonomuraea sp. LPB2021202275-12-8]|uniref:ArsR/SmtB family transcription factor n=1 Tax=Nonomuraea sp. LPB2021202275-12-8 TaxID=3120159 RepID=UPI00300CD442
MARALGVTPSAVSQHLGVLRESGLVARAIRARRPAHDDCSRGPSSGEPSRTPYRDAVPARHRRFRVPVVSSLPGEGGVSGDERAHGVVVRHLAVSERSSTLPSPSVTAAQ